MRLQWIAALTLAAATAFAQGPGGPPPDATTQTPPSPDALKAALGLTDSQVTALDQLQQSKRTQLQPILQQLDTQRTALHDAMQKTPPDATAIAAILVQIQTLQKQVQTVESSFQTQAVATLTADQKTKLVTLQNAQKLADAVHQAEMLSLLTPPEGGPGGPGGPPHSGTSAIPRLGNSFVRHSR
jgi:Spy/CpxP family protein refolding chaperone